MKEETLYYWARWITMIIINIVANYSTFAQNNIYDIVAILLALINYAHYNFVT